jgi:glutamate N-acetyltransferase/amino-acid N-acetyltransferase
MSNKSIEPSQVLPVPGVRLAAVSAGIKKKNQTDLVLIEITEGAQTAAVFTQNAFCAAPVIVAREHLRQQVPRYLLINSGNANAGTGQAGVDAANACCQMVANATGCNAEAVLPFSTGVIGQDLPLPKFEAAIPDVAAELNEDAWLAAAQGIMTTDTVAKAVSQQVEIAGQTVTVTGIAKGSGMIRPDMATLLAFIATDASVTQEVLQQCLRDAVGQSFNRVTIDGDTSTNDACVLAATGKSGTPRIEDAASDSYMQLSQAVNTVSQQLAKAIAKDGEGATKLVTVQVEEGASEQESTDVAYTIAHSPLVKTALFASDPNWGRILAAIGRAGLQALDIAKVRIYLDEVCIVRDGARAPEYEEAQGQAVFDRAEFTIRVLLGRGDASTTVWTCDFSYDYVRINAEYRT